MASVRVSEETLERLRSLADGRPLSMVVDRAVDAMIRELQGEAVKKASFTPRLRETPKIEQVTPAAIAAQVPGVQVGVKNPCLHPPYARRQGVCGGCGEEVR